MTHRTPTPASATPGAVLDAVKRIESPRMTLTALGETENEPGPRTPGSFGPIESGSAQPTPTNAITARPGGVTTRTNGRMDPSRATFGGQYVARDAGVRQARCGSTTPHSAGSLTLVASPAGGVQAAIMPSPSIVGLRVRCLRRQSLTPDASCIGVRGGSVCLLFVRLTNNGATESVLRPTSCRTAAAGGHVSASGPRSWWPRSLDWGMRKYTAAGPKRDRPPCRTASS